MNFPILSSLIILPTVGALFLLFSKDKKAKEIRRLLGLNQYETAEVIFRNDKHLVINNTQTQKIEYLRGKLNSISYTAKYLIETCNFVIDKPRKLTVRKYNTMAKSNELLFENFNKLLSKRQVLLYVAIIERSNN